MKFKFIHKISVIQETFLVLYNLLQVLDIARSGAETIFLRNCGSMSSAFLFPVHKRLKTILLSLLVTTLIWVGSASESLSGAV